MSTSSDANKMPAGDSEKSSGVNWWTCVALGLVVTVAVAVVLGFYTPRKKSVSTYCIPPWVAADACQATPQPTPQPTPRPQLVAIEPGLTETEKKSPHLIVFTEPSVATRVYLYGATLTITGIHPADGSYSLKITDDASEDICQEWRLVETSTFGLAPKVCVWFENKVYQPSQPPAVQFQITSGAEQNVLYTLLLPSPQVRFFYYGFFAARAVTFETEFVQLHIAEDNLVWREVLQDGATADFARFLLHYKPTPDHLEPKYVEVVRNTLLEACTFLKASDFRPLACDDVGGPGCYDVYIVAPDETVGLDHDPNAKTHLEQAFGYVAAYEGADVKHTSDNSFDQYSYMVLESGAPNDPNSESQSKLLDGTDARLTVAHELFHSLQFAANSEGAAWFTESSAVAAEYLFEHYYSTLRKRQGVEAWERIFKYSQRFLSAPAQALGASSEDGEADVYGPGVFVLFCLQRGNLPARFNLNRLLEVSRTLAQVNSSSNAAKWPCEHALRVVASAPDAHYADEALPTFADLLVDFHAANALEVLRSDQVSQAPESVWKLQPVRELVAGFLKSELQHSSGAYTHTSASDLNSELQKLYTDNDLEGARLFYVAEQAALPDQLARHEHFPVRFIALTAEGTLGISSEPPVGELTKVIVAVTRALPKAEL